MKGFLASDFFDLSGFAHAELFDGCQYVWQVLDRLAGYLAKQRLGKSEAAQQEYAYLVNPELISIGEGTIIEPGAYIKGPCIIGKHCHIRHGAYIRGDVILGDHCVVGHASELKATVMLNHAQAAHFAYVGDSVIGSFVNLGAGVKCANLRLDGQEIVIHCRKEEIATSRRKFGAIIGDHSQIGCNSVMNPGTLVGKHVHCHPCINFGGIVEDNSRIQASVKPNVQVKS
jgi:UDP-N-acetylglucosamine diphosphorylase / glucose-1-phosphate thymidylyltransferase / UDP-N-acetylgalactosamine diphosphorylase / glucosamine-1-phosphate N-acetyltransferase / galactosamine-1-phosphate N-acetyltransferase